MRLAESPTDELIARRMPTRQSNTRYARLISQEQNVLCVAEKRVLLLQIQPGGLTCRTTSALANGRWCLRHVDLGQHAELTGHRDVWGLTSTREDQFRP
jgi:hypothetical protein